MPRPLEKMSPFDVIFALDQPQLEQLSRLAWLEMEKRIPALELPELMGLLTYVNSAGSGLRRTSGSQETPMSKKLCNYYIDSFDEVTGEQSICKNPAFMSAWPYDVGDDYGEEVIYCKRHWEGVKTLPIILQSRTEAVE